MRVPEGPGYEVSTHMLDSAARYLNDQAQALAGVRNSFNDLCYGVSKAFGASPAATAFNDFFSAWFSALDGQAETMGAVADAAQQAATVYDHAARARWATSRRSRSRRRPRSGPHLHAPAGR